MTRPWPALPQVAEQWLGRRRPPTVDHHSGGCVLTAPDRLLDGPPMSLPTASGSGLTRSVRRPARTAIPWEVMTDRTAGTPDADRVGTVAPDAAEEDTQRAPTTESTRDRSERFER